MHINHWMTFGTFSEQRFFIYPKKETYSGVIINGNMAVYAPDGLGQFILEKTDKLKYLIDPLTHAFQHDVEFLLSETKDGKKQVKSSIRELSDKLGPPISHIVGDRPIQPKDFRDKGLLKDFVINCLDFQLKQLSERMLDSDTNKKYLNFKNEELCPYALITPYFYMEETTLDDWLPIQTEIIRLALEQKNSQKLFTAVVIDKGIISSKDHLDLVIQNLSKFDLDGYLIWVDDLNENETQTTNLKGLLALAKGLRKRPEQDIINLHGGYFSTLAAGTLGNGDFSGVAHGPEYGEFRSVVPIGGGIPIAKYYIRAIHKRTKYKEAIRAFRKKGWLKDSNSFHQNICNCQQCRQVIQNEVRNFVEFGTTTVKEVKRGTGIIRIEYPTTKTKENCLLHYLQMKAEEYKFSGSATKEELLEDLVKGITDFEDTFGSEGISHLKKWKSIFTSAS